MSYLVIFVKNKCQKIPKGQSKMYNPEKLASQGTQDEDKQGITPHKDNSMESTKFCETFS